MAAIQLTAAAMEQGELALAVGADAASAVSVLSATAAPPGVPSQALIKVPSELRPSRVKGAIMANGDAVKAVVPNRVVRIAQALAGEANHRTCEEDVEHSSGSRKRGRAAAAAVVLVFVAVVLVLQLCLFEQNQSAAEITVS